METITLREKLHSLIDNTTDDKLEEVYHLLSDEPYTDLFKKELDDEFFAYQKDGEVFFKAEIDNMIDQLLYEKK